MKKSALLLFIIIFSFGFRTPETPNAKGIEFFKGTFSQALAESKKTGKPLFIDVYAYWCGPCKQLKTISFKDKEAGTYFNKNFINFSIDGETPEGEMLQKLYDVNSYPTLLIVDSNAKQLARTTGFMKPLILINFGRRVVP